jgi:hypothetical protein
MIKFEFDSHDQTPEDQYVKEVVTFKFTADNESWYVPYFHKTTKEGGSFWSPAAAGVQYQGKKKYFEGYMLDSRHRSKQVIDFLNERAWEKRQPQAQTQGNYYPHGMAKQANAQFEPPAMPPTSMSEVAEQEPLPF